MNRKHPRKRTIDFEKKKARAGFLFTLIWLIGFLYFFIVPFVNSFLYSLSEITVGEGGIKLDFVGIENYIRVFSADPQFTLSLVDTVREVLWQFPLILVFSVFIAIILNNEFRGRLLFRVIFFLPVIIASGTIIGLLKTNLQFGNSLTSATTPLFQGFEFERILAGIGLPVEFIQYIMRIVNNIFNITWKSGVQILLFLSGLQAIPAEVYEAAEVEGCTRWEMFWKITFPLISSTTILCAFYTIVDIANDTSYTVVNYIRAASRQAQFSTAATYSVIWFLIVSALAGLIFVTTRKKIYYTNH
jgi:ABC-type sugar transport system permease subunit